MVKIRKYGAQFVKHFENYKEESFIDECLHLRKHLSNKDKSVKICTNESRQKDTILNI